MQNYNHWDIGSRSDTPKLPISYNAYINDLTASQVRELEKFAEKNGINITITRGIKKPLTTKKAADLYVSTPQTREYAKLHRPDANIAEKPKHKTAMTCPAGEAPPAGKKTGKCIAFPCQDSICRMFNCKG